MRSEQKYFSEQEKGNDLEKALLDPARLSRTGAGPVLAARGFGFEEWAAPVEPRWDRSQEPPNGLREAKSPPNTPTPDGPWAPCLACFFSSSSPSSSCVLQNAINLDASASSGPHPFIDPDAFLPVILISILFSSDSSKEIYPSSFYTKGNNLMSTKPTKCRVENKAFIDARL